MTPKRRIIKIELTQKEGDKMDKEDRIKLIRKGNELFNKGDIIGAAKIYIATNYADGLIRVGDYFYYEKKQPIVALKFYRKANFQKRVNEIYEKIVEVIRWYLAQDRDETEKVQEESKPSVSADEIRQDITEKILFQKPEWEKIDRNSGNGNGRIF